MNKEELENELYEIADFLWCNEEELKEEIFKLVPEILKSIIDEDDFIMVNGHYFKWYTDKISGIKQKAKDLYNITL